MYIRYRHRIQPILILGTGWAHPDVQILVFSAPGGASVVSAAIPVDKIMVIASQAATGFRTAGACTTACPQAKNLWSLALTRRRRRWMFFCEHAKGLGVDFIRRSRRVYCGSGIPQMGLQVQGLEVGLT
jgi:hypothetical protein